MQLRGDISVSMSALMVDICSTSVIYMQQSLFFSVVLPSTSSPAPSVPLACFHSYSFSWFLSLEKFWIQQWAGEKKALALQRFFLSLPRMASWIWWEMKSHFLKGYWYLMTILHVSCFSWRPIQTWVCVRSTGMCLLLDLELPLSEQRWVAFPNWSWFPEWNSHLVI